jgi:uncharacterized cupredoxin-like copper-binding protein
VSAPLVSAPHVSRWPVVVVAAIVAVGAAGCARGYAAETIAPRDRTVELRVHHSTFIPATVSVPVGSHVRFVVRNDDPIDHELIIGDAGVQLRHERGTEAWHPPRPGEVSVAAGALATTTFTFLTTGTMEFACHMPGHDAYGMRGVVTVTRSPG